MFSPIKNHILELDEQVTYRIKRFKRAARETEYGMSLVTKAVKTAMNLGK